MKSIRHYLLILCAAMAALGESLFGAPPIRPRRLRLANTYDAALATHESAVNRTNDAAVTARHLLWKKGASDGTVAIATASDYPLGTIDNVTAGTDENQSVLLLGRGSTKKMVASGAIAAGVRVFAAAAGKVAATGTVQVGVSLTAAAANNDVIEVNDHGPILPHVAA